MQKLPPKEIQHYLSDDRLIILSWGSAFRIIVLLLLILISFSITAWCFAEYFRLVLALIWPQLPYFLLGWLLSVQLGWLCFPMVKRWLRKKTTPPFV